MTCTERNYIHCKFQSMNDYTLQIPEYEYHIQNYHRSGCHYSLDWTVEYWTDFF